MSTKNLIKGLQLLETYRDNEGGYNAGAEHDTIYCYETDRPLNKEDIKKMITLTWHQDVDYSDDCEFQVKDYDPEESWVFYT